MNRAKGISLYLMLFATTELIIGVATSFAHEKPLILTTTTSVQDSGLLDVLIPFFEKQSGYFVKTIAVGSGQAMAMGRKGEADVLLVHSPDAEGKFMEEGSGLNRRLVMHNDFVIVGPSEDPARIKGAKTAKEALQRIASAHTLFLSRGGGSGPMPRSRPFGKQREWPQKDRNGTSRPARAWGRP